MEDDDIGEYNNVLGRVTRYKENPFGNIIKWIIIGGVVFAVPTVLLILQSTAKLTDDETISMLNQRGYENVHPTKYESQFITDQCPYRPGGYQIGRNFTATIDGHNVEGVLCTSTLKRAPEVIITRK